MNTIKTILFVATILVVGFFVFKYEQKNEGEPNNQEITKSSPINDLQTVSLNGEEYAFAWIPVDNLKDLYLYANFEEKYTLEEMVNKYDCENLVSGGFYSENHSPIGLFISEEKIIGTQTTNALFNGYFTLTKYDRAQINNNYMGEPVRIGLQTGPLLIQDGLARELKLTNDKTARRIVAALTDKNELFFIVFYNQDSVFLGPLLDDLPSLVVEVQDTIGVKFVSAINLDGGSASAFYKQDTHLSELVPVGSFFCEK